MGGRPVRVLAEPDPDRLEELVLDGHGHPGLDQLEDAEEGDQGLLERGVGFEVFEEVEHVPFPEERHELLHLDLDRDVPAADDAGVVGGPALHHQEERLGQVEERQLHRLELALAVERRDEIPLPLEDLDVLPLPEEGAGGLDLLVLDEAVDQDPARVLVLGQVGLARQEHLGLDVDQERGDEQELGLAVEVDLRLAVEVVEVVAGDGGDGDVVDVDLLLADEEEEEVERAFEDVQADLVAVAAASAADGETGGVLEGQGFGGWSRAC